MRRISIYKYEYYIIKKSGLQTQTSRKFPMKPPRRRLYQWLAQPKPDLSDYLRYNVYNFPTMTRAALEPPKAKELERT